MPRTSALAKNGPDRATWALWAVILLGAADRGSVLFTFGFRYIGIDDALIQSVAVDMGNGLFREPFLYGQNYNPMLEALLAAPFVRAGAAPWVVLPVITSLLALLPFWSIALWCKRRGWTTPAFVFAAMPLLLPVEWGLITTQSRGFVHGLAWMALLPWAWGLRSVVWRDACVAFVLGAAAVCNPNALPVALAAGVWIIVHNARRPLFWVMGLIGAAPLLAFHLFAQQHYTLHPEKVVHGLSAGDLAFDPGLLGKGLVHAADHFRQVTPLSASPVILPAILLIAVTVLFKRGGNDRIHAIALMATLVLMIAALGIPKIHEGCTSVFFPLSRMFLALPLVACAALALWWKDVRLGRSALTGLLVALAGWGTIKAVRLGPIIAHELVEQSCAWVREEPLAVVQARCRAIKAVADAQGVQLVAPVRWPHLRVDHGRHFIAHFTCYACPQLVPDFPPTFGAGFDRRSWVRERYASAHPGRILFVGGDPNAWNNAQQQHPDITAHDTAGLVLHTLQCDTATVEHTIRSLRVDDDLDR